MSAQTFIIILAIVFAVSMIAAIIGWMLAPRSTDDPIERLYPEPVARVAYRKSSPAVPSPQPPAAGVSAGRIDCASVRPVAGLS